jgi:hypothetical protein
MIGLSTLTYDLSGYLVLQEDISTDTPLFSRRVTRTAVLNGLGELTDLGFSESDGTFYLSFSNIDAAGIDTLEYLIKNYSKLRLSSKGGCFEGVLSLVDTNNLPVSATFLIERKVSE